MKSSEMTEVLIPLKHFSSALYVCTKPLFLKGVEIGVHGCTRMYTDVQDLMTLSGCTGFNDFVRMYRGL